MNDICTNPSIKTFRIQIEIKLLSLVCVNAAEVEKKLLAFKDTNWNLQTQREWNKHLNVCSGFFLSTCLKLHVMQSQTAQNLKIVQCMKNQCLNFVGLVKQHTTCQSWPLDCSVYVKRLQMPHFQNTISIKWSSEPNTLLQAGVKRGFFSSLGVFHTTVIVSDDRQGKSHIYPT